MEVVRTMSARLLIALVSALLAIVPITQTAAAQIVSGQPETHAPTRQPIQRPAVETLKAAIPAIAEVVCRPSSFSAGLDCKPSGAQTCPAEVLHQLAANTAVRVCAATCKPQSASAGQCDCTFVLSDCRPRTGR